jgi:hypothetical protein
MQTSRAGQGARPAALSGTLRALSEYLSRTGFSDSHKAESFKGGKIMSEQELMEAWVKSAAPAKEHQMLAKLAGDWNVEMITWMSPKDPPTTQKGTTRMKMILGGRVLTEEFVGDIKGQPYEGFGMMGYDKFNERYWQTWTDNMGTGLFHATGTATPDGRTITMKGKADRPMQKLKGVEMKTVYRILNDREHVFETYDTTPDGKEIKTMEIHYNKK